MKRSKEGAGRKSRSKTGRSKGGAKSKSPAYRTGGTEIDENPRSPHRKTSRRKSPEEDTEWEDIDTDSVSGSRSPRKGQLPETLGTKRDFEGGSEVKKLGNFNVGLLFLSRFSGCSPILGKRSPKTDEQPEDLDRKSDPKKGRSKEDKERGEVDKGRKGTTKGEEPKDLGRRTNSRKRSRDGKESGDSDTDRKIPNKCGQPGAECPSKKGRSKERKEPGDAAKGRKSPKKGEQPQDLAKKMDSKKGKSKKAKERKSPSITEQLEDLKRKNDAKKASSKVGKESGDSDNGIKSPRKMDSKKGSKESKESGDSDTGTKSSKKGEQPKDLVGKKGDLKKGSKESKESGDSDTGTKSSKKGEQLKDLVGKKGDLKKGSKESKESGGSDTEGKSLRKGEQPKDLVGKKIDSKKGSKESKESGDSDTEKKNQKKSALPKDSSETICPKPPRSIPPTERKTPTKEKKKSTVISFDAESTEEESYGRASAVPGKPKKDQVSVDFENASSSRAQSPRRDEKIKEYYVRPKGCKPRRGKGSAEELACGQAENAESQGDYILVFLRENDHRYGEKLETYLENLENAGLLLESIASHCYPGITFIRVTIASMGSALNLASTYRIGLACLNPNYEPQSVTPGCLCCLDTHLTSRNPSVQVMLRNRESVKGFQPTKPTTAERIMIVYEMLRLAKFGGKPDEFGVEEMKKRGILTAAYPIHDGQSKWTEKGALNDRQLLKGYWASILQFYRIQPVHLIQKYFGPEAGFYYAIVSLYMAMLTPAAAFGLIPFMYGLEASEDVRIKDICKMENIMCPVCATPEFCNYSMLRGSCKYSKLNYLFDNDTILPFAIFMSFWGIVFVALWERKQSLLTVAWNIHRPPGPDVITRPDYYADTQGTRLSPLTNKEEPYMTTQHAWTCFAVSVAGMLGVVLVVLVTLFVIILFRIAVTNSLSRSKTVKHATLKINLRGDASINTAIAAAVLSTVIIIILDHAFNPVAFFLTNVENPRTQREFDRSYIAKMFFFSFVNNYTVAVYLALFREIRFTDPSDRKMWDSLLGVNADMCDPSGCVTDLWIFITVIVIAKPLYNISKNLVVPILYKRWSRGDPLSPHIRHPQWEMDYELLPVPNYHFAKLNIELIIQYGYVICFASCFQLLALLVLVVNIIELRINAMGLVRSFRRLVPKQPCERDIWSKILYIVTIIGIFVNAFIVGVTMNWVDRAYYKAYTNPKLANYTESTISKFATADYNKTGKEPIEECFYPGRRFSPQATKQKYENTGYYYESNGWRYIFSTVILMAGLALGLILHHVVATMPNPVKQKINYQERKNFNT